MKSMNVPRLMVLVLAVGVAVGLSGCLSSEERELAGIEFEARSGQDATGEDLAWIDRHPVRWSMDRTDGRYIAVITPPCAMINAPVNVTSDEIVANMDRAGIAAVACNEPTASIAAFVRTLIVQPLSYTWDGETLTLTNETGSLTFDRTSD
jgi:hypothetical protein